MYGLEFNDVAIMTSGFEGVDGSVTTTEPDVANEYTYTFDTSKALNSSGDPIPFHKDKLRVVAFLIKGDKFGTVVNAAKCNVVLDPSGIQNVDDGGVADSQLSYNLAGQRVNNGFKGVVIKGGRKIKQYNN